VALPDLISILAQDLHAAAGDHIRGFQLPSGHLGLAILAVFYPSIVYYLMTSYRRWLVRDFLLQSSTVLDNGGSLLCSDTPLELTSAAEPCARAAVSADHFIPVSKNPFYSEALSACAQTRQPTLPL